MEYTHIFWDWNGTLFDDALPTCESVNLMLEKRSLKRITLDEYRELIEVPIINFYKKVMDVSCESMEDISNEFHFNWANLLTEQPLFDDTAEVLTYFKNKGIKQYIFSSSQNKLIEPFLKRFKIEDCFEAVLGAPDCHVGSKVKRTCDFIENSGIDKSAILFVGDMVHDFEVASNIGSDCVLISHGHQCSEQLKNTGCRVFSSLTELQKVIK